MNCDNNKILFWHLGKAITYGNFIDKLKELGADDCDVLFIHSDISFGKVDSEIKRAELKKLLVEIIKETGVKTIIFPTFTFSYCNNEDFDIQKSPTSMGMLPEYVRTLPEAKRTDDPIMSVAIIGDSEGFEHMDGDSSCGIGGIFHQLHKSKKKVKFLFFGVEEVKCFTFLHYVEEIKQVPYRYSKDFTGCVINNGIKEERTVEVFVRYKDVIAILPDDFSEQLLQRGIMKKGHLGAGNISVICEDLAYNYISELIEDNPYVFCQLPEGELIKEFTYGNVRTM